MAAKAILILCAQALVVKMISGQCLNAAYAPTSRSACGAAYAPVAYTPAAVASNFAPTSGGQFGVSSVSPISPGGVSVLSENAIEGALAVAGTLPFLGTVALEGVAPTTGAGVVNYGCGNANVGILNEGIAAAAIAPVNAYGFAPIVSGLTPAAVVGSGVVGRGPCGSIF